ncbi:MAG: RNA-binding cell elongation regulator Jag/EloR [Acidimicrobiales bacterium]
MEWVEASGKTLAEAKEIVLDHLGVAEDDAEFVIVSEPKAGLFGRQRGEARVQARVRPVAPPPKRGRRQRSDRGRNGQGRSRSGEGSTRRNGANAERGDQGAQRSERGRSSSQSRPRKRANGAAEPKRDVEANGSAADDSVSGGTNSGAARRRRSRGRRSASQGTERRESAHQPVGTTGESEGNTMEESLTLAQQGEVARDFLAGLVREFGLEADVNYEELDEDTVQVSAAGDDLGLLVGPRGATLAAVQDLTRTFVQRQSETRTDRILVDVGGYRAKRAAALRRFTEGIVAEVRSSGEERALEPMPPADRKVIHDAVNEVDGVETRSEGVEPERYVVIQLAG